jgi:polysaccharide export outer membrane protein
MSKIYYLYIIIALGFLNSCAEQSAYKLLQTDANQSKAPSPQMLSSEYIIMPHDRLRIYMYRSPESSASIAGDMSQEFDKKGILVNMKGYIYLPLIKKVKLVGLTQTEASRLLTRKYKKYLKFPMISLEVMNKRIYIIGEVHNPGPINLDNERMTLLEAIAHAGDFTDGAVRDNIIIVSKSHTKKPYLRKVDLTQFSSLSHSNMMLLPNDVIYVQPDGWKEFEVVSDNFTKPFKVISEIASPFVTMHYLFD